MRRDISDYADSTNSLLASASGVPVLPILHLESGEQVPTSLQKHGSNLLGPGSAKKAENAYHVAQALAWSARSRRDVQDQLDWMLMIPNLMNTLLT